MNDKEKISLTIAKVETEQVLVKTLRLFLSLFTNISMALILFISVLYACESGTFGAYQLHIVLCVLGYHGLMCQGILVVSKYNYWSIYLKRRLRVRFHLGIQVAGLFMVIIGSVVMCKQMYVNFTTTHGILALCALIMCLISALDGIILMYAWNMSPCISAFWTKFGHYILGVSGLVCATASLCAGFKKDSFKKWANNDGLVEALIVLSCIYTILVLMEFSIAFGRRLRNRISINV